jgi:hypothetical protein
MKKILIIGGHHMAPQIAHIVKANTEIVIPITVRGEVKSTKKKTAKEEPTKPRAKDPRQRRWVIKFFNKDNGTRLNREVSGTYEYAETMRDSIIDSQRFKKKHCQGIDTLTYPHNPKYNK